MSFDVLNTHLINPAQSDFKQALEQVDSLFVASTKVLYRARNEIRLGQFAGTAVVIKKFRIPNPVNRFIYGYLRKPKAQRAHENALELEKRGIPTPSSIGCRLTYQLGLLTNSYYLAHYVEPDFLLEQALHGDLAVERFQVFEEFGQFMLQLHQAGVQHLDLSPGNVLITKGADSWTFYLVDLNRMRFGPLNLHQRMRNFAKLWASDADLRVIVQAYAHAAGINAEQAIALALRYSRQHKKKALLSEKFKRFFRGH